MDFLDSGKLYPYRKKAPTKNPPVNFRQSKMNRLPRADIKNIFLLLIKISRPPLWPALPLVFCLGLAYGKDGLGNPHFRWNALMVLQMVWLSFPVCLYTFGINDIFDFASDMLNPRKNSLEGIRLCMSSKGFGQIEPKVKRWFRYSYKPFLPFFQDSKSGFASSVNAWFFA